MREHEGQRERWIARLARLSLAALTAGVLALVPALSQAQQGGPTCAQGPQATDKAIVGTPCADLIVAQPGVAQITGGGGGDKIYASHAVAYVDGGDGNDQIFGEIPVGLETGATAAA